MKGSKVVGALVVLTLLAMQAWSGNLRAEEGTNDGRVTLKIQAADPDGGQLFFFWVQKEGRPVKIADPRAARFDKASNKWVSETYFVPTEPDNYVFEVTVKNENGLETTKRFTQEVLPATPLPIAKAGADQKVKVGQKVVLSGQESTASNNRSITKYQWAITLAPEGFTLPPEVNLTSRQFDFIAKAPGKYTFTLKVNDGKNWGEPTSVDIVATRGQILIDPPENSGGKVELPPVPVVGQPAVRPKAIAEVPGAKKGFKIGDTIVLDGSKSIVNEAETPKFFWKQIDDAKSPKVRALTPDIGQPFSAKRTDKLNFPIQSFVAQEGGIYKFVLSIDSASGIIESDPVAFQVVGGAEAEGPATPPGPPVKTGPTARLTASKAEVSVGEEVTLDGSKSSSEDGSKLTFIWAPVPGKKFPDNIRGTDGPVARFSAEREGEYSVMLLVNDGKKQGSSEPVTVRVLAGNKPPVIELEPTQKCNVGEVVAMEAKIRDPQNLPLKIRWTCLEPKSLKIPAEYASEARFRFTPRTPGTYLFQVEAVNEKGLSSVAQTQIGVKDATQVKPTAVITGPESGKVGDKITLSGAQSFSPAKKPLTYKWSDESDGGPKIKDAPPNGKKQDWTFKVTEPGRHVIVLVVNDGTSDSEAGKFAIDVAAAAAPITADKPPVTPAAKGKPTANITGPKTAAAKSEVELSAEGSTGEGALQYYWTQQIEGGPDLALTGNQRRGKILRFIPVKAGTYILTLDVVDQNNQRSETQSFTVEVKGAAAAPPTAAATLLTKDPSAVGKEVRLTAEKSSDAGGAELKYKWKQTAGPQKLVIAPSDNRQEIVVTPSKPGAYELQVTVNNGELESPPAIVAFNVSAGALPQAVIAEIAPPSVGDTVVLDGTGSKSPNGAAGDQLQYFWKQKQPVTDPVRLQVGEDRKSKVQFVVPNEGSYVWELVVNDGNDDSPPAQITFVARPRAKNIPPIAVVERPVIGTEVGVQTVIDASASNDPDKGPEPLTFRWRKGNNELKQSGPVLTFTPPSPGTLKFEVQAYDGKDYSEPVQIMVNVAAAGALPVAVPTVSPNPAPVANRAAAAGAPVKGVIILDGTKSRPVDKNLTYAWRQVGGDNLKLQANALAKDRVGIRIYKPGDYKFELTVSDGENVSLPATVDLKVVEDESAAEK